MKKIRDLNSAIETFEEAANLHGLATEKGDYKSANKSYTSIVNSITFLREKNQIDLLLGFLNHTSVGVRMWGATFLLPHYEKESKNVLEEIANINGIHSLTALTTLNEWKKGNLKL